MVTVRTDIVVDLPALLAEIRGVAGHPSLPEVDVIRTHLREGSFTLLAPAMASSSGEVPRVVQLHRAGCFAGHPAELAEALSCAAFVGATESMRYLLDAGVAPDGGSSTGLNALHWAANRGQLAAVRLLLDAGASLEVRNAYGGTVLGAAVWAAVHETKPEHLAVIEVLLHAGADVRVGAYPSGDAAVDALLAAFIDAPPGMTCHPTPAPPPSAP